METAMHYDVFLNAAQCERLRPHPLAASSPRMSAEQYQALRDDVATVGVQRPITIDNEAQFAMEGIHRARAAAETGKGAPAIYFDPERDGEVCDFRPASKPNAPPPKSVVPGLDRRQALRGE